MESSEDEAVMTTQITPINLSDVRVVDAQNLALPMQYLVSSGRGLVMLRGVSEAELREVDRALWDELSDNSAERLAMLVRFRCLVKVFAARRLSDLLMHTGYRLIAPAVRVAAQMRLNADLGFNPIKFERALLEQLGKAETEHALAA
jgi:hypothetical protein